MLQNYHIVRDKGTANFYVDTNKTKDRLNEKQHATRSFYKQNKRKEIDTFISLNDSRFEMIQKSPANLSNVKKVTGVNFKGYDKRGKLFPEKDQTTFYDANKEVTMKGLQVGGAVNWKRMTKREAASPVVQEQPEDCYDYAKAMDVKTVKGKPRQIVLANMSKQYARDDIMLKTSDAFVNVQLENTKEDRELEIQAKKEQRKRYLNIGMM